MLRVYNSLNDPMSKRKVNTQDVQTKKTKFPVTLAKNYDPEKHNVFDGTWAWSLKLDGVRAYWDCKKKQLLSRNNKEFVIPKFLYNMLCAINLSLDGEIFAGKGNFSTAISTCRKQKSMDPEEWRRNLTFQVFDLIDTEHDYAERMNILRSKIPKDHNFIQIVAQNMIKDRSTDLFGLLDKGCANGEEGIMLKKVSEPYEHRRSPYLLKMKQFHDTEMKVIDFIPGKGKHTGVLGAIMCRDKDGNTCKVGSGFSEEQRKNHPFKLNDWITIKYFERTKADKKTGNISYRFPTFLKRKDELEGVCESFVV